MHPRQALAEPLQLDRENRPQVLLLELAEDDRFVETVQQLGTERALRLGEELLLEDVEARLGRVPREAEGMSLAREVETEVRRADDDRVAEVDDPALAVREAPLVEDL